MRGSGNIEARYQARNINNFLSYNIFTNKNNNQHFRIILLKTFEKYFNTNKNMQQVHSPHMTGSLLVLGITILQRKDFRWWSLSFISILEQDLSKFTTPGNYLIYFRPQLRIVVKWNFFSLFSVLETKRFCPNRFHILWWC